MNKYILALGYGTLLSNTVLIILTFYAAFTAPDRAVTVLIDKYGEANIEFSLMLILQPIAVLVGLYGVGRIKKYGQDQDCQLDNNRIHCFVCSGDYYLNPLYSLVNRASRAMEAIMKQNKDNFLDMEIMETCANCQRQADFDPYDKYCMRCVRNPHFGDQWTQIKVEDT